MCKEGFDMSISGNYANYVNSFYSNDVNILKKRQKQSKIVGAAVIAAGAVSGTAALLSKNPSFLMKWIIPVLGMLGGANCLNYSKQTEKKIAQLEAQA